jgi:hypothetical protein
MKDEHGAWCKDADRWNSMWSEEICSTATLSTTDPNGKCSRVMLAVGITAWAKERPKILQTWITIMYDVKYGLQSDTWYTVCTMISDCLRTVVPNLIQGLPPAVRQRLCFSKMELMHCMGNMTQSDWRRQFYCIYVVYGVWSLDTVRHCSVSYPKQQRSQAICCVVFKIYRVRRNQIMGTLFTNLLSL